MTNRDGQRQKERDREKERNVEKGSSGKAGFAHLNEQQRFNPRQNEKYSILTLTDQAGKQAVLLQSTHAWKVTKTHEIVE